jgi:hypothetical protein
MNAPFTQIRPEAEAETPTPVFTPGPWLYGQNDFQKELNRPQFEVGLAVFPKSCGGGISGLREDGEYMLLSGRCREGDARLMAMALELYGLADQLAEMKTDEEFEDGMSGDDAVETLGSLITLARQLRAKARGEQA